MLIERILATPIYAGLIETKPFKDHPGELFPGIHEPIIDMVSLKMVQSKLSRPKKTRTIVDDQLPFRGILKCHCGNVVTGAPSRGKSGQYFYYYKCRFSKHNNISAKKAHAQFDTALKLMSLPLKKIENIRTDAMNEIERELEKNRQILMEKKTQLASEQELLYAGIS